MPSEDPDWRAIAEAALARAEAAKAQVVELEKKVAGTRSPGGLVAPTPVEHLVRDLSRVAPASVVRRAARACGALQCQDAVDIHALLMTVVLGVSVRGAVSLAEVRRVYSEVSGTALARSSFYGRFNDGLAALGPCCPPPAPSPLLHSRQPRGARACC